MTEDACCEPGDCKTGRLRIGAVLLAAGEGARLGGRSKGSIEIAGEPLLLRGLRILSQVGIDEVVVVTGHYQSDVAPLLIQAHSLFDDDCLVEVTQPTADHSQSDSLRLGVASLSQAVDAVMVLPVDMPALTRGDLVALVGAYKHADPGIEFVGPLVGERPGNPVLFSRRIALKIGRARAILVAARGATSARTGCWSGRLTISIT